MHTQVHTHTRRHSHTRRHTHTGIRIRIRTQAHRHTHMHAHIYTQISTHAHNTHIHTQTHTNTTPHTHTITHNHAHTYPPTHLHTHTHTHNHKHTHIHTHTRTHTHIPTHPPTHTHLTHTHAHTHKHTHIHTHIHTYTLSSHAYTITPLRSEVARELKFHREAGQCITQVAASKPQLGSLLLEVLRRWQAWPLSQAFYTWFQNASDHRCAFESCGTQPLSTLYIFVYIYTVYLAIFLPKTPYTHRIYMVLAIPIHVSGKHSVMCHMWYTFIQSCVTCCTYLYSHVSHVSGKH